MKLINKWLVTGAVSSQEKLKRETGLCLDMRNSHLSIPELYSSIQNIGFNRPLAILLSAASSLNSEDILGVFFHPAYYMVNYQPVVFIETDEVTAAMKVLNEKARVQGFADGVSFIPIREENSFVQWQTSTTIDYQQLLTNWTSQALAGNSPSRIHVLIPQESQEGLQTLDEQEVELGKTETFRMANALFQREWQLEEYRHQLYLKTINEKNTQFYLDIQKKERANGLQWYHYEYEILPLWYKRFGQMIKVMQGKRSFRSLFRDDVKKYKE